MRLPKKDRLDPYNLGAWVAVFKRVGPPQTNRKTDHDYRYKRYDCLDGSHFVTPFKDPVETQTVFLDPSSKNRLRQLFSIEKNCPSDILERGGDMMAFPSVAVRKFRPDPFGSVQPKSNFGEW